MRDREILTRFVRLKDTHYKSVALIIKLNVQIVLSDRNFIEKIWRVNKRRRKRKERNKRREKGDEFKEMLTSNFLD